MNNRNKKRVLRVAVILFIIALCPIISGAAHSHTFEFYVNDSANVLSEETENHIYTVASQLEMQTTAEVCVLTIDTTDGEDIAEYSVETFRNWGIGDSEKENGVLIVLSVEDREMWVTTGYGIEGTLTDVKLGQFRDTYAIPYYSQDDFDQGTRLLFDAIINTIRTEEYGLEPLEGSDLGYLNQDTVELTEEDIKRTFSVVLIPILLITGIFIFQEIKYLRLKKLDKQNGTNLAPVYRIHIHNQRRTIFEIILFMFLRGGRGGRGGGGRSGNRGGGGSTGGGGAGGSF